MLPLLHPLPLHVAGTPRSPETTPGLPIFPQLHRTQHETFLEGALPVRAPPCPVRPTLVSTQALTASASQVPHREPPDSVRGRQGQQPRGPDIRCAPPDRDL